MKANEKVNNLADILGYEFHYNGYTYSARKKDRYKESPSMEDFKRLLRYLGLEMGTISGVVAPIKCGHGDFYGQAWEIEQLNKRVFNLEKKLIKTRRNKG